MEKAIAVTLSEMYADKLEVEAAARKQSPDQLMAELVRDALEAINRSPELMCELLEDCLAGKDEPAGKPQTLAVIH